jgi:hypothetical protein
MSAWLLGLALAVATEQAYADEPPSSSAAPRVATSAEATAQAPTAFIGAPSGYRRATTWDVNLDGALGSTVGSEHALTGFGRLRAGLLVFRDADVFALGATYEYSNLEQATFGVQAEYISDNSGLWIQLGALLDTQPQPGAMVAVGYALFGAELQVRSYESLGVTFSGYAKLRIPIGFLAYELAH